MAIQMRRGLKKDFDPTRMLPGEWAVSIDTDTSKQVIWMCFGPGVVKRMGTYEDFSAQIQQIVQEIEDRYIALFEQMKAEIEDYYNQSKEYAESAQRDAQTATDAKDSALESASEASSSATTAIEYASNAETSANSASESAQSAENSKIEASTYVQTVVDAKDLAVSKASEASVSEINAQTYANNASTSEDNALKYKNSAQTYAENAETSASNALASRDIATTKANEALNSANTAQSYAIGGTGTREGENTDNSKYYSEQSENAAQRAESIAQSMGNIIIPKGTVTFENLPPLKTVKVGWMYNISNEFVTTDDFADGAGLVMPQGTNVYKTDSNLWDAFSGNPVTGVKGSNESTYRKGNVNITKANIGLGSVDNTADMDKPISTATQNALDQKPDYEDIPSVPSWAMEDEKPSYTKSEVGLGNVDNTSDVDKPISNAVKEALKDKIGKTDAATSQTLGLVKPDGTTTTVDEDGTLHATALPQEQADWQQTDSTKVDFIKNKPTIPTGDGETIAENEDGTLSVIGSTSVPDLTYAEYMAHLDEYADTLVNVKDVSDGGFKVDETLDANSDNAIANKSVAKGLNGKLDKVIVIGNANLNDYRADGTFYCMGGANSPCGHYGFLTVYPISNGNTVKQIYSPYNKPQTYVRYFDNNSWHEWNAITANYNQKYAWVNHDVNNRGTCNANEVVFLGWRANTYGVDGNATHKMYLEDFPNKPSNFTIDNCKIMYATTECSADWGMVGRTSLAMYNQDGMFAFGRIHSTNQFYTVKALLMRTDI